MDQIYYFQDFGFALPGGQRLTFIISHNTTSVAAKLYHWKA
jgi:hypothetical protein